MKDDVGVLGPGEYNSAVLSASDGSISVDLGDLPPYCSVGDGGHWGAVLPWPYLSSLRVPEALATVGSGVQSSPG